MLAALAAAAAVWMVVTALRPAAPDPGREVLVAAADLPVGTVLSTQDLRPAHLPEELVPAGALTDPAAAIGRVTAGQVPARAVLTRRDVSVAALVQGLSPGTVAAHLAIQDAGLASAAAPGTRVDVLSVIDGTTLAGDVVVLAADPDGSSGVFVAVQEDDAAALARHSGADMLGGVTLVLRPVADSG